MCHMDRGWGGRARKAAAVVALALFGMFALSVPALSAGDPPPVPKPDPPPKAVPPPPPVSRPPAPQPVSPVAPVVTAPAVVHPTAAERRAAAQRSARRKAARAARAKRVAAAKLTAAHRRERAQTQLAAGSDTQSSSWGLPFLLAVFGAALLMLGLAVTPARAVPWSRASRVLEDRRDEFGVMGAMGLVATFVFFLLVQVTK